MTKINQPARKVISKLMQSGYEAYLVGGCVRDALLEKEPHDVDIATDADPKTVMKIFGKCAKPTGLKHGTVTVFIDHESFEITTYRTERYTQADHQRLASVQWASTIEQDLSRRDFTINAMAYSPEKGLVDPYHGASDLLNHRLKCVLDPIQRFNEDALRILRGYRFAVTLDLEIEKRTLSAMESMKSLINTCSKERIWNELDKIFRYPVSRKGLEFLFSTIFPVIFPELEPCIGFDQKNPYHEKTLDHHIIDMILNIDEFYEQNQELEILMPIEDMKFAALFHDIGKPETQTFDEYGVAHYLGHAQRSTEITKKILRRFHFPKTRMNRILTLIEDHQIQWPTKTSKLRKKVYNKSEVTCMNILAFQICDKKSHRGSEEAVYEYYQILKILPEFHKDPALLGSEKNKCAITGKDVMEILDLVPGIEVGKVLELIKDEILEGSLMNDRNKIRNRLFEMKGH